MKFYDSVGPNPRVVRMFAAERGASLGEKVTVDLRGGENRQPAHMARNPFGQMPTLELTPEFETDERGAMVFLEECIKEARGKISAHYLAVEQVYSGALQNMRQRAQGRYISPTKRS